MPAKLPAPALNYLLDTLPTRERRRVVATCNNVALTRGEVLYQSMQRLDRVYFPTSGFVSLIVTVDDSAQLEVGLVGDEGVLGVALALGAAALGVQAVVQGSGRALCMSAAAFNKEISLGKSLACVTRRYAFVQLRQLSQMVACTRFHVVEARLARWLLMTRDRAHADTFYLTHELLGTMLGVRRVGITNAAGTLQKRNLIQYSRGNVTILDRRGLKATSCSCYQADRDAYASGVQ